MMPCKNIFESEHIMVQEEVPFVDLVRGPYIISSRNRLTEDEATTIVQTLRRGQDGPEMIPNEVRVLGGRSSSTRCLLPSCGQVFVKHYSHGGLLRSITGGYFIGSSKSRSAVEFEMLERVRQIGIEAPKPVAIVKKGALLYETWLIMEELSDTRSLVDIQDDEKTLYSAMKGLTTQVLKLVQNKIFHVDLHPGNVLTDSKDTVYLIDFDKAVIFDGDERLLRDLYLRRWRRAVIKHKLSPIMAEMMALALRSHND